VGPPSCSLAVLDQGPQARVWAKEMFADVGAALDGVALELAIDGLVHLSEQDAVTVPGQEVVPLAAPDDLDHIPSGTAEHRFEFLDDLAVTAHRAVEALKVAVDDKDQVVEFLAGRQMQGSEGLWFVGFAVTDETPHLRLRGVVNAAVV
jgi:hypothetical protein